MNIFQNWTWFFFFINFLNMRINEYVLNWIFLSHFNIFLFIFLFLISFTFKFLSWFLTDHTICLIIYCKFFSFDLDFRLEIEIIFTLAFLISNLNISMETWICSKIGLDGYYFSYFLFIPFSYFFFSTPE